MKLRTALPAAVIAVIALTACDPRDIARQIDIVDERVNLAPHVGRAPQAPYLGWDDMAYRGQEPAKQDAPSAAMTDAQLRGSLAP